MNDQRLEATLASLLEIKAQLEAWGPPGGEYIDKVILWRRALSCVEEGSWWLEKAAGWHVPR